MVSYLADVLVRVATHPASRVEDLLPANWARKSPRRRLSPRPRSSAPTLLASRSRHAVRRPAVGR